MGLSETMRWLTAAQEREELSELRAKKKRNSASRETALRRTIKIRLGTELTLVLAIAGGALAKLQDVFSSTPSTSSSQNVLPTSSENVDLQMQEIDFDHDGMLKKYDLSQLGIPNNEESLQPYHEKIGGALNLALQDPNILATYRDSTIEFIFTDDVNVYFSVISDRFEQRGEGGSAPGLNSWQGDGMTVSMLRKSTGKLSHIVILQNGLLDDPAKLANTIIHELGHIKNRNDGVAAEDYGEEEVATFTSSIECLRRLIIRLRNTNGPDDAIAKRIEESILPKEQRMLESYRRKQ